MKTKLGIVGARGHTGSELIRLIVGHPDFELAFVSSREFDGQRVADHIAEYQGELRYSAPSHEELPGLGADAVVLALPNGKAAACVAAFDAAGVDPVIVDLSADYRFDPAWHYGLPELARGKSTHNKRIANPGCYATAMQLAIAPMHDVLDGPVQCFGVSGYSGAGTTPSEKNDPDKLRDNLMPYALTDHLHEREVTHQMHNVIEFMPHVASYFRGLTITANMHLSWPYALDDIKRRYHEHYVREPLVHLIDDVPMVRSIVGKHHAEVGGLAVSADGQRLVVVATLDNLLKGAATQALQNLNIVFGFDEFAGIPLEGIAR